MGSAKAITVNVTRRDIERGRRFAAHACPIARALRRKLGVETYVYRTHASATTKAGTLLLFAVPQAAADFICSFDNGQPVEPARFTLTLIEAEE